MPDINDQHNEVVDLKLVGEYFTGEPQKLLTQKKEGDGEEEKVVEDPEDEEEGGKAANSDQSENEEVNVP